MIYCIKTISLDTFQLSQLAHDLCSTNADTLNRAKNFQERLLEKGYYIFLSFHHILELLNHNDYAERFLRVSFLKSLPFVAWIKSLNGSGAGSIADLLSHEVKAASSINQPSFDEIRCIIKNGNINYGSGREAFADFADHWEELKTLIREQSDRDRKVMAISRSNFVAIDKTKLSFWDSGKIRPPDEVNKMLQYLESRLYFDIDKRGDKRINDKRAMARDFFVEVRSGYEGFVSSVTKPASNYFLKLGLTKKDLINTEVTMEYLGDLVVFRRQISVVSQSFNAIDRLRTLKLYPTDIPSQIVINSLKKFGQSQPEWKGSELGDRSMCAFSPYIDICCVDKRTHNDFITSCKKSRILNKMELNVVKYSHYFKIKL